MVSAHSTAPALAQCIGDINIVSPKLPNVCDNIYNPKEDIRQSTPIPEEDDILQAISINGILPDIRNFIPENPIHPIAPTDNVHQYTSQFTIVSGHQLDPTSPAQFCITSSLQPTTSSIVYSTSSSSQQVIPPPSHSVQQHQPGAHQLVQQ